MFKYTHFINQKHMYFVFGIYYVYRKCCADLETVCVSPLVGVMYRLSMYYIKRAWNAPVFCNAAYCIQCLILALYGLGLYISKPKNKCWLCPCRKNHLCIHMPFLRTYMCNVKCVCASVPKPNLLKAVLIPLPPPPSPPSTLCNRWKLPTKPCSPNRTYTHTHSIRKKCKKHGKIRLSPAIIWFHRVFWHQNNNIVFLQRFAGNRL